MGNGTKLRARLERGDKLVFMGAWDVLSARVIERLGFDGVAVQSNQYAAGWGVPDVGILSAQDMLTIAFRTGGEVQLPLVIDFEQGFGASPGHAAHWALQFERAGVAAVHIDDKGPVQICSWLPGAKDRIEVSSAEETAAKIKAIVDVRTDLLVIARCSLDSGTNFDPQEEMRRLRLYRDAGADILFAPLHATFANDLDAIRQAADELATPLFLQFSPPGYIKGYVPEGSVDGRSIADRSFDELFSAGISIINSPQLYPIAYRALEEVLKEVKADGSMRPAGPHMLSFQSVLDLVGYDRFR